MKFGRVMILAWLSISLMWCGSPRSGGSTLNVDDDGGSNDTPSRCPGQGYIACRSDDACPCGLVCARVSTNATERYCTQSCDTDSDCGDSTRWSFSSVGCNPRTGFCTPR
jgi:hypothetical protein